MAGTAREYLTERNAWLNVVKVPKDNGGFDIAIVIIDGTYSDDPEHDGMLDYHRKQLATVLSAEGIPRKR